MKKGGSVKHKSQLEYNREAMIESEKALRRAISKMDDNLARFLLKTLG